jgi:acyl carrier protein
MSDKSIEILRAEAIKVVSRFCHREVSEETRLIADLNLDSLDTAELVAEIEDHFAVVIPMEQLPEIKTVEDIARSLVPLFNREQQTAGST